MSNIRPINIGTNAESFFLNRVPEAAQDVTVVDRTKMPAASPASVLLNENLRQREEELKLKLKQLQRREAESNMLHSQAQQELFNVQIDRHGLDAVEQNTQDQMHLAEAQFKTYQLQQRGEELERLELQAKLVEMVRAQKEMEVHRIRNQDPTMSQLLVRANDREGINKVFNLRVSNQTEAIGEFPDQLRGEQAKSETTFSYNFQREIGELAQNPFSKNKKVSFNEGDTNFEHILKEFDVRTILKMADEHKKEKQRRMEESFENPNADETKIMKAQKYALKDRNDPSTELQHTGQQIAQLDQASKQLREMALRAQEETKVAAKKSFVIQPIEAEIQKASLFRKPQRVRSAIKDLNRQLDEANVELGDYSSHNLEGQDSFSETVSVVSDKVSVQFSDNSGYYVDNKQDLEEKQAFLELVNQDRKLTPNDNGLVMPKASLPQKESKNDEVITKINRDQRDGLYQAAMVPPLSKQFDNLVGNLQLSLASSNNIGLEAKVTRTQDGRSRAPIRDQSNRTEIVVNLTPPKQRIGGDDRVKAIKDYDLLPEVEVSVVHQPSYTHNETLQKVGTPHILELSSHVNSTSSNADKKDSKDNKEMSQLQQIKQIAVQVAQVDRANNKDTKERIFSQTERPIQVQQQIQIHQQSSPVQEIVQPQLQERSLRLNDTVVIEAVAAKRYSPKAHALQAKVSNFDKKLTAADVQREITSQEQLDFHVKMAQKREYKREQKHTLLERYQDNQKDGKGRANAILQFKAPQPLPILDIEPLQFGRIDLAGPDSNQVFKVEQINTDSRAQFKEPSKLQIQHDTDKEPVSILRQSRLSARQHRNAEVQTSQLKEIKSVSVSVGQSHVFNPATRDGSVEEKPLKVLPKTSNPAVLVVDMQEPPKSQPVASTNQPAKKGSPFRTQLVPQQTQSPATSIYTYNSGSDQEDFEDEYDEDEEYETEDDTQEQIQISYPAQKAQAPVRRVQEQAQKAQAPVQRVQEQAQKAQAPVQRVQAPVQKAQAPVQAIQKQKAQGPLNAQQQRISEILNKLDPNWTDASDQAKYGGYRYSELLSALNQDPKMKIKMKIFLETLPHILQKVEPSKQQQVGLQMKDKFFRKLAQEKADELNAQKQAAKVDKPQPVEQKPEKPQSVEQKPERLEQKIDFIVKQEIKHQPNPVVPQTPQVHEFAQRKSVEIQPNQQARKNEVKQYQVGSEKATTKSAQLDVRGSLEMTDKRKTISENLQFKPWMMPDEDKILKHFKIDPNEMVTLSLASDIIRKSETEYFGSLSNVKLMVIGPERMANQPMPCGTTAVATTKDLYFFAYASESGFISIYSAKDLLIKGLTQVNSPVTEMIFHSGLLIVCKLNGSVSVFKSNVRPFDSSYNTVLADCQNKLDAPDLKEIIPFYEFTASLNGKPQAALPKDGKITSCVTLKGRSVFEHTVIAGIDDGRLMYLSCEIAGDANQKQMVRQSDILKVNLSVPSQNDRAVSPRHNDRFKVVYNKKPLHGQSRILCVQKAANKLVISIDIDGIMFVQQESRKVISVGQIILQYSRFMLNEDSFVAKIFPTEEMGVLLDPAVVYKGESEERRIIEQYMGSEKINIKQIQTLAVDNMSHPMTNEKVFVVPVDENQIIKSKKRFITIITMNCHSQLCRIVQYIMKKNRETGKVEKGPENVIFPNFILEKKGIHIDADSGVKYERGSDQLKAILKFIQKPENKHYVDDKWLLEFSVQTAVNEETGSKNFVVRTEDESQPPIIQQTEENVKFMIYRFNKADQLCAQHLCSMKLEQESELATISDIKMSKEQHLMIVPLVKNNLFGSSDFGTIEFLIYDTTTMTARPRKLQLNYNTKISWAYDITQQLTLRSDFLPFIYFMNGPQLQIASLTTLLVVKTMDMRKLTKVPLNRLTCLTHRYVLFHSKKNDQTFVLTMEDSFITLNEYNEITTSSEFISS